MIICSFIEEYKLGDEVKAPCIPPTLSPPAPLFLPLSNYYHDFGMDSVCIFYIFITNVSIRKQSVVLFYVFLKVRVDDTIGYIVLCCSRFSLSGVM